MLNKSFNNWIILVFLIFSKQCQILPFYRKYPSHIDTSYYSSNYHRAHRAPIKLTHRAHPIDLPSTPSSSQIELIIELTHRAQNWDHPSSSPIKLSSSPSSSLSPNEFTHRALIEPIELTVTEIEMTIYAKGIFRTNWKFGIVLKRLKILELFSYLMIYSIKMIFRF